MPIGWLQLVSNKLRFAAAATGVGFACILVFVQLGMLGAFTKAMRISYTVFNADIMISASDSNGLAEGSYVARRRLYQALAVPGVKEALPVFVGKASWLRPADVRIEFITIGIDPSRRSFIGPAIVDSEPLKLASSALLDSRARGLDPSLVAKASPEHPLVIETNGRQVSVVGTTMLGAGFAGDGFMVVSDQTFLRLFPARSSAAPNHVLLRVDPGQDAKVVAERVRQALNTSAIKVQPFDQAIDGEINFQTTRRPVGLIFGFGVLIGILVGVVIVYQILSTDVADHLSEYATFKAMGFSPGFFRSIVLEEAVVLAVVGFVPALIVAVGIYAVMAKATNLPIAMSPERAGLVFLGTVLCCSLSGILAMRKLTQADPADLF
jgi:putative ABC transport system permease protein